jgi:hypothetical protein
MHLDQIGAKPVHLYTSNSLLQSSSHACARRRGLDLDQALEVGDAGQCCWAISHDYSSNWPNAREMQMSDNPIDVIEAAIRAAFTLDQARRVRAVGAGHTVGIAGKGI